MKRIQLSNVSFEGDNNVYLLDDDVPTLIDTGDWTPETREKLASSLAEWGLAFADIERVFLTHWHGDHVGLADEIQEAGGATVYVHELDAPLVRGDRDAWDALSALHEQRFEEWGIPEDGRETLRAFFGTGHAGEATIEVTPIQDGESFSVGGSTLKAVHAPGHAAGLCLYEFGDEVFSGDALLPKYTPNVGGADVRVDRALEKYLRTLEAIETAGYDRAWPGHRDVISDPASRAREIITHHEERSYRVLDALSRLGPTDAWTVSADLFGELESIHILHGPGESYAHLEHLREAGAVHRDGHNYSLADGVADELATLETERWPL